MATPSFKKNVIFTPKVTSASQGRKTLRFSLLLGGAAAIVTSILVIWVVYFQTDNNITIDLNKVANTSDGRLELQGLSYQGQTARGEPFTVNAERASEAIDDPQSVMLSEIDGRIETANNGIIKLSSTSGLMRQSDNHIHLEGNVVITQSQRGLRFVTETLIGELDKGRFEAPENVELSTPNSLLTGEQMLVTNFGDIVKLNGKSKAIIGE